MFWQFIEEISLYLKIVFAGLDISLVLEYLEVKSQSLKILAM